ncbi:uncharacterized protein LOC132629242 [Lycium barbarum]|uniref:uncharacterized protein LOC132629242 n=1 Tax=Lycium barbarum TaxID=112863 RepID=UPI00293E69FF|nr:uncharacterized protein LOC132629242 [Lycium barbarum]
MSLEKSTSIDSSNKAIILDIEQKTLSNNLLLNGILCKSLVFLTLILYLVYFFLSNHPCCQSSSLLFFNIKSSKQFYYSNNKTNISHLVFGIAASSNTWGDKRWYITSWWKPNITRGYVFLDRTPNEHLPWPISSPPFRISSDNSRYAPYNKHRMPFAIRMVRVIEETFAENHGPGIRWYVMVDDDTVLMIDNLVNVLSKYDHTKYYYVGMNSECIVSNFGMSFQMAFGGAGYALSYPLAQAVAKNMDTCIKRYPTLYGSDHILQACIADLGVTITLEKGFHQIDLRGDISGFLSAHPQSPFLSLHHLDLVAPIFPSMNRYDAVNHLMKAASVDQSRLLQQSTCYNNRHNWTFSVSWGYSVQIYDKIQSQSYLERPIETFGEWRKGAWPPYMFNVRGLKSNKNGNSCGHEVPNVLFFDNVEGTRLNHIVTTYVKKSPRGCGSSGNDGHSIDGVLKIRVFSPMHKLHVGDGNRRECCDIVQPIGMDSMAIKLRTCMKHEIIG